MKYYIIDIVHEFEDYVIAVKLKDEKYKLIHRDEDEEQYDLFWAIYQRKQMKYATLKSQAKAEPDIIKKREIVERLKNLSFNEFQEE